MRMGALAVFVGLVLSIGAANATIPDEDLCTVLPCDTFQGMLVCPDSPAPAGFANFVVHVRNGDNEPIPDAFVEIVFGVPGNHCFCPLATLTGSTDEFGNASFNIAAGGCRVGANAVRVIANDVQIRSYANVKSPDYDGASDCVVGLTDFIVFANGLSGGLPGCTDYYNDGGTDLSDFITFGQGWAHTCP